MVKLNRTRTRTRTLQKFFWPHPHPHPHPNINFQPHPHPHPQPHPLNRTTAPFYNRTTAPAGVGMIWTKIFDIFDRRYSILKLAGGNGIARVWT